MTPRNGSPGIPTDDLRQVHPPARVSRPVRADAAFLRTGGRLAMGAMLPSAVLTTARPKPVNRATTSAQTPAERKCLWAIADRVYPLWPDYRRHAGRCHRPIPIIRLAPPRTDTITGNSRQFSW